MRSHILETTSRLLLPLLLLFSLFLLQRGHNLPGGGFVGGLVTAAAYALYTVAYTVREARLALRVSPRFLFTLGLSLAAGSGLIAMFVGDPFLTGQWFPSNWVALRNLGTPLIFDVGVYLTVLGVVLTMVFALAEE